MLDAIRYMVVYNPIIFLVFSLLAHLAPHHTVHRWVLWVGGAWVGGVRERVCSIVAAPRVCSHVHP